MARVEIRNRIHDGVTSRVLDLNVKDTAAFCGLLIVEALCSMVSISA